jgi:hypothetical protein
MMDSERVPKIEVHKFYTFSANHYIHTDCHLNIYGGKCNFCVDN